jgi:hypothetical protein
MTSGDAAGLSHAELVKLVVELSQRLEVLAADNERLRAENERRRTELAKNSGNSSKPPSRDPAAERKRQAEQRQAKKARAAGGKKRRPGKQPGDKGNALEMTDAPDEVIDHAPDACSGCGAGLGEAEVTGVIRRQVIETTDRIGTATCWMHVVSTGLFTLIHASVTRGTDAIVEAGVLIGYRGVIVHDRLALYWKLKKARHGLCAAHLLRDLASVAEVATQTAWAAGLAGLLVEINAACDAARAAGHKALAPTLQRVFRSRYDALVADGLSANPDPAPCKRARLQRQSFNLAAAFDTHRQPILRYMYDLDVSFTNNQAERDLRPVKIHRKISSCFRSHAGAERFASVRSYLSTTRKNDVGALEALTRLFNGDPWMPPQAA